MNSNSQVLIATVPFGATDRTPLELMTAQGITPTINPMGRRLQPEEVAEAIGDHKLVIAGTEQISADVIAACPNLRAICRVGIGLDSVDLIAARNCEIAVSYTPDGPSPAVAELTIGLMVDLLRGVNCADRALRNGEWSRVTGRRLAASTVGVIGVGRIGCRVVRHLANGFPGVRILAADPVRNPDIDQHVTWTDIPHLLGACDVVSVHTPLTPRTRGLIGASELSLMPKESILINTARGGIVDEDALDQALCEERLAGAAVDVFEVEPYQGPLRNSERALLTCHMGSMTRDCRARMEIEATEDALRFLRGEQFANPVPEEEYAIAEQLREAAKSA